MQHCPLCPHTSKPLTSKLASLPSSETIFHIHDHHNCVDGRCQVTKSHSEWPTRSIISTLRHILCATRVSMCITACSWSHVVTESGCPGCEEVQQQCTRYSELRTSENLTPDFSARISVSAPVTAAFVYTEQ